MRLPCLICGGPADRFIDNGVSGVALYCGNHSADVLEPLACEPIVGRALYALNTAPDVDDEVSLTTLDGFLAANTDPEDGYSYLDDETIAALRRLEVEEMFDGDQGAAGTWTLRRIS